MDDQDQYQETTNKHRARNLERAREVSAAWQPKIEKLVQGSTSLQTGEWMPRLRAGRSALLRAEDAFLEKAARAFAGAFVDLSALEPEVSFARSLFDLSYDDEERQGEIEARHLLWTAADLLDWADAVSPTRTSK